MGTQAVALGVMVRIVINTIKVDARPRPMHTCSSLIRDFCLLFHLLSCIDFGPFHRTSLSTARLARVRRSVKARRSQSKHRHKAHGKGPKQKRITNSTQIPGLMNAMFQTWRSHNMPLVVCAHGVYRLFPSAPPSHAREECDPYGSCRSLGADMQPTTTHAYSRSS